jgi:hypothetical protein
LAVIEWFDQSDEEIDFGTTTPTKRDKPDTDLGNSIPRQRQASVDDPDTIDKRALDTILVAVASPLTTQTAQPQGTEAPSTVPEDLQWISNWMKTSDFDGNTQSFRFPGAYIMQDLSGFGPEDQADIYVMDNSFWTEHPVCFPHWLNLIDGCYVQ